MKRVYFSLFRTSFKVGYKFGLEVFHLSSKSANVSTINLMIQKSISCNYRFHGCTWVQPCCSIVKVFREMCLLGFFLGFILICRRRALLKNFIRLLSAHIITASAEFCVNHLFPSQWNCVLLFKVGRERMPSEEGNEWFVLNPTTD